MSLLFALALAASTENDAATRTNRLASIGYRLAAANVEICDKKIPAPDDTHLVICATIFWVDQKRQIDAGADGDRVRITSGLMKYVPDDNELAAVVAHELAHNILEHPDKLATVTEQKKAAIRATEVEADRLSIWLMANAGFAPQAAADFWQRYRKSDSTHPKWQLRASALHAEIAEWEKAPQNPYGIKIPPFLPTKQCQ